MKKFLLFLFVPLSLFAQFEDDYYIIQRPESGGSTENSILKDFNIVNNNLNEEYELNINYFGEIIPAENSRILTYSPDSHYMYASSEYWYLRPGPKGGYEETLHPFTNPEDVLGESIGYTGYWTVDSPFSLQTLGHVRKSHEEFYATIRSDFQGHLSIISKEQTLLDLNEFNYIQEGLAYNPDTNSLYFIAEGAEALGTFYLYEITNNQLSELPTDFGSAPLCCNYKAMHFMRGQNKIMMADFESGDFYTYDLNTNLVELYAETDLQFVTGIVNKHDFLGNVEVYNQGEIKIYPNPVKENLHIETNSKITRIELFNIVGQKLEELNNKEKFFNLSNQSKGVYILKIQMENGKMETKKIIKN